MTSSGGDVSVRPWLTPIEPRHRALPYWVDRMLILILTWLAFFPVVRRLGQVIRSAGATIVVGGHIDPPAQHELQRDALTLTIGAFIIYLTYFGVFDVWGATPGKALRGLRVVNRRTGQRLGPGRSLVRTAARLPSAG